MKSIILNFFPVKKLFTFVTNHLYMRKLLLIAFLLSFVSQVFAQSDCDELQSQNDSLKAENSHLQAENSKLIEENEYLRETMNLLNSSAKIVVDDIEFSINRVVGDKQNNEVSIYGIFKNLGPMKTFQARDVLLIDPQGNQVKSMKLYLRENKSPRVENAKQGIPMKFRFLIEGVSADIPEIRLLTLRLYGTGPRGAEGDFENLQIDWQ